jgi:hypothetical protein
VSARLCAAGEAGKSRFGAFAGAVIEVRQEVSEELLGAGAAGTDEPPAT